MPQGAGIQKMKKLNESIIGAVRQGASDVHITGGLPLIYRKNGIIHFEKSVKWTNEEVDLLTEKLLTPRESEILKKRMSVDFARTISNIRARINVFFSARGLSFAIRLLPGKAPELRELNLHPSISEFCKMPSGLILVCGVTGCGKSTTIAAMVEEINKTRPAHIISLEDPVERRFQSKKSFIEQRELGFHFPSFEQGLLDVLREDPDIIVVGELREKEVMRLTLNAVEAGHLVIASIHGANSEDVLHRICNSFPSDAQDMVRNQLASTLTVLLVQKLVLIERVGFRVPLLSILRNSHAVKSLIRENKLSHIENAIQTSRGQGMFVMEKYKENYLDNVKHFFAPHECFAPSEEILSDPFYTSTLKEKSGSVEKKKRTVGQLRSKSNETNLGAFNKKSPLVSEFQTEPFYDQGAFVLDEDIPLEEIVAQIHDNPKQLERILRKAESLNENPKGD